MKGTDFAAAVKSQVQSSRQAMEAAKSENHFNPFCGLVMGNLFSIHEATAEYFGNGFTEEVREVVYLAAREAAQEALSQAQIMLAGSPQAVVSWRAWAQAAGMEAVKRAPWMALVVIGLILLRWGPAIVSPLTRLIAGG